MSAPQSAEKDAACPSTVTAHLGFKAERQLPCGLLAGHGGKHVFHIEWSDRITAIRVIPPATTEGGDA